MGVPERNGQATYERGVLCPYPLPTLSERTANRLGDRPRFSERPSNRLRIRTGGGRSRPANPRSSPLCMRLHPRPLSPSDPPPFPTRQHRPHPSLVPPPPGRPPL